MSMFRVVVSALLALKASGTQSPLKLLAGDRQEGWKTVRGHAKTQLPPPAGFFGDFSQGESTYTYDGTLANRNENPMVNVLDGWNPPQTTPTSKSVKSAEWFESTKSGGEKRAWQTFYPAMPDSNAANQVPTGDWFKGTGNSWQQDYKPSATLASDVETIPASWFDNSVSQIDGFGRDKYPGYGEENPRWSLYWEEKSVNTTLTCEKPGCTANTSLKAPYSSKTDMAKNCKLSVLFHPTDFDDQYSGERVEWIQLANGGTREIMSNCHPMDHGGNATAWRPLLPCVEALPVEIKGDSISVAAKIPEVVDENKYDGKLLSAVAVLTCLVTPKVQPPPPPKPQKAAVLPDMCKFQYPLQCPTRGCAAQIAIHVGRYCLQIVGKCTLNITVNQTDFDNKDGTEETIEYLKVDGATVLKDKKPGQNPCKSAFKGKPVADKDLVYDALTSHKLTWANSTNGTIMIEGKISQYVDECASNGYLLDAIASVECIGTNPASVASPAFLAKRSSVKHSA